MLILPHTMSEGGQLNIGVKVTQEGKNKNLQIIFQDIGYGIPKENLERIFEPFFTTLEILFPAETFLFLRG